MKQIGKLTMMLFALLLWTGCSEETTQGDDDKTLQPDENTLPPREVMFTLNNELKLMKGTTKAGGDTPVATAEENAIASLDVFVFGCATEEGDYTFQEMFSYRADDAADLPLGATVLELTPTDDTNKQTKGLLKLKKGLFVKLYCIANCTSLTDPAGDPVDYTDFVPLVFTQPGETGTTVATEGLPTETQFTSYHTPLLKADKADDILLTPLAMSGAYTIPLDLTDFSTSTQLQIGFKLTRVAARFDIINKADESRFTIREVSMGNGRRGSTFFPIRIYGDTPTAQDGELITYPARPFDGENANTGTQTGAFYSYPSPAEDNGFIILKGTYQTNKTDQQEVSYQIPFTQTDTDGNTTILEINNNHRYTIAITEVDDYHLDFTLTVADWTDSGDIDDYNPSEDDNKQLTVDIPAEFTDTKYDPVTKIVNLSLKANSKVTANIGTNAALSVQKTYAGGLDAQQYDWLEISEPVISSITKAPQTTYGYTLSPKSDYDKKRYPRCIIRFTDTTNGTETILFVEAQASPQVYTVAQDLNNRNTFDTDLLQATMYRVTGSKVKLKIICPDGTTVKSKPDWLDVVAVTNTPPETIYEFKLKDENRDAEIENNKGSVVFQNVEKSELETEVTVVLADASITPNFSSLGGTENTYDNPNGTTSGNVNMTLSEGNTFHVSTSSLDGIKVGIQYTEGDPAWLSHNGENMTKAGTQSNNITFSLNESELAKGSAKKATVTLQNKSGGIDHTFTVTPVFKAPIVSVVSGTASPTQNSFSNNKITLYKVSDSHIQVKASIPGGSKILNKTTGINVTGGDTYATENTYTVTWDNSGNSNASFDIVNKSDNNQKTTVNVDLLSAAISANETMSVTAATSGTTSINVQAPAGVTASVTSWGGGDEWFNFSNADLSGDGTISLVQKSSNINNTMKPATIKLTNKIAGGGDKTIIVTPTGFTAPNLSANSYTLENLKNDNSATTHYTFTVSPTAGSYEYVSIANSDIATVSPNGKSYTVTAKQAGTTTIKFRNKTDNSKTTSFSITVKRDYNGQAVWLVNGVYIAPVDIAEKYWDDTIRNNTACNGVPRGNWKIPEPTVGQYLNGTPGSYGTMAAETFQIYTKNGILQLNTEYWGSPEGGTYNYYMIQMGSSSGAYKNVGNTGRKAKVRCISR